MTDLPPERSIDPAALERASRPKGNRSPLWADYFVARRQEYAARDAWLAAHAETAAAYQKLVDAGEARYD